MTEPRDVEQTEPKRSILLEYDQNAEQFESQVRVRFRVGRTELLVGQNETGESVPGIRLLIPPFATFGMACLRLTRQVGHAALELDDYAQELLFKISGEDVLICSTMLRTTVPVNFEQLFEAWQSFALKVKGSVIKRHPEKVDYGYWALIDQHPDSTLAEELTRGFWFEERIDCFK